MQLQYQVALLATVMVICNYNPNQLQLITYFLKYDIVRQLKYNVVGNDTYFLYSITNCIQLSSLLCQ